MSDKPLFDKPTSDYLAGIGASDFAERTTPATGVGVFEDAPTPAIATPATWVADCPACSATNGVTERSHTWIRAGRMHVAKDGVCSACGWDFTYSWDAAVVESPTASE